MNHGDRLTPILWFQRPSGSDRVSRTHVGRLHGRAPRPPADRPRPGAISAQTEIGFRGGLNFATIGVTDDAEMSYRAARNLGVFVSIPETSVYAFQIGISFSSKGTDRDAAGRTQNFSMGYLEFSVLAKLSIPTQGNVGIYFLCGATLGVRVTCTLSASFEIADALTPTFSDALATTDCDEFPSFSQSDKIRFGDVGALVGAGLDISVGQKTSLLVEVHHNRGLFNIIDGHIDGVELRKHRAFSILAGLSFKTGA